MYCLLLSEIKLKLVSPSNKFRTYIKHDIKTNIILLMQMLNGLNRWVWICYLDQQAHQNLFYNGGTDPVERLFCRKYWPLGSIGHSLEPYNSYKTLYLKCPVNTLNAIYVLCHGILQYFLEMLFFDFWFYLFHLESSVWCGNE